MPQSTQSRAHPLCMDSIMDPANALGLLQQGEEKKTAGFIFTEVSIVRRVNKTNEFHHGAQQIPLHNLTMDNTS